jgi:Arm domain-containing DNA-binding protein
VPNRARNLTFRNAEKMRNRWTGIDIRLTKTAIERAKLPEPGKKERFIRDDLIRDLGVRITARGEKRLIFEGKINGRPRRLTIGVWPDMNVQLARLRAMEIRASRAQGQDPHAERLAARHETTFGELIGLYLERHANPRKRSAWQGENTLRHYVADDWNSWRLPDIPRAAVAKLASTCRPSAGRSIIAKSRLLARYAHLTWTRCGRLLEPTRRTCPDSRNPGLRLGTSPALFVPSQEHPTRNRPSTLNESNSWKL